MLYLRKWATLVGKRRASGGFGTAPVRFQWCIRAAVRDPSLLLNFQMRLRSSVLHFAPMSGRANPPCSFGRRRVVTGTLNGVPCQLYQEHTEEGCWIWLVIRGAFQLCTRFLIGSTVVRIVVSSRGSAGERMPLLPVHLSPERRCPNLLKLRTLAYSQTLPQGS